MAERPSRRRRAMPMRPLTARKGAANRSRPPDLQAIVKYATMAEITRLCAYTVDQDSKAAEELATKHGVNILRTPDEVLRAELEGIDGTPFSCDSRSSLSRRRRRV
jgi:hypothetical protein